MISELSNIFSVTAGQKVKCVSGKQLEKNGNLAACLPSGKNKTQLKLTSRKIWVFEKKHLETREYTKHLFLNFHRLRVKKFSSIKKIALINGTQENALCHFDHCNDIIFKISLLLKKKKRVFGFLIKNGTTWKK